MTKIYSLAVNGKPLVSVSMNVPDFLPRQPQIDRKWLRGIVTEQVSQHVKRNPTRPVRSTRIKEVVAV